MNQTNMKLYICSKLWDDEEGDPWHGTEMEFYETKEDAEDSSELNQEVITPL